jgi:D-alanyl-D-alanine carboxypeptidase (penicillin-binding protein 5/6)
LSTVPRLAAALAALLAAGGPAAAHPERRREAPEPRDRFPGAAAAYLLAIGDRELWARAADAPRPPASLTKLMTALVLLDEGWSPAAEVVVSARAAREGGTRAGLRAGERVAAGDLLAAALVASANDACVALAEHAAGSEAAFVARMNARAAALGLAATHFDNACGHDGPTHRASARDLLRLARAALARPEVRRLAALPRATVTTRAGRAITLQTTNALLGRVEGATGLKSGFTPGAGKCLVAVAERAGVEVVLVLLDAQDRWWAGAGLLEAAFREAGQGG